MRSGGEDSDSLRHRHRHRRPILIDPPAVDVSGLPSPLPTPSPATPSPATPLHQLSQAGHKLVKPHDQNDIYMSAAVKLTNSFGYTCKSQTLDDRVGSVAPEYDAAHNQSLKLMNYLSSYRQPSQELARTTMRADVSSARHSIDSRRENNGLKGGETVIVINSDDEDEDNNKRIKNKLSLKELLLSKIQDRINSKVAAGGRENQLVPYGHQNPIYNRPSSQQNWQPTILFEKVILNKVTDDQRMQDQMAINKAEQRAESQALQAQLYEKIIKERALKQSVHADAALRTERKRKRNSDGLVNGGASHDSPNCIESFVQSEPETSDVESDGLDDLWKDMSVAMECTRVHTYEDTPIANEEAAEQPEDDCSHSFLLQDDLGLVCRVCGVIQKKIETIFDFQWKKPARIYRSQYSDSRNSKESDDGNYAAVKVSDDDFLEAADISVHPRHAKQMRPHQVQGFKFLVKNLVCEAPGGCILAHAPGSGKTFMLISFIQSFLAKYPSARPLVVLPKGILATWKREFQKWQVEDISLYDFYSVKAEKRREQLEVLNSWQENKSILFLGYKQFSTIICGAGASKVAAACQERLLKVPSLLILDEGHTPRNEDTNVLESLARVQTRRKVVLSGTLFQNHVREVFNILNLVRPKFLKMDTSRAIVKRILSRVAMSGSRRFPKGMVDSVFSELVEDTLRNDHSFKRKINIIRDLRELTKDVLHYYRGDFLDDLPGLVDLTVHLKLSPKQKDAVRKLPNYEKFKRSSVGCAIYIHPCLCDISEIAAEDRAAAMNDAKIDNMVESVNIRDGVKAKFFLSILSLAEASREKVLAFSQYILPLKFLERLLVSEKGWQVGREIFMISGDSSADDREWSMDQFNNSADAKVLFGSIKACGEGISLVGASRVVVLDVHLNPSVTRQAIGRAFRPGQEKRVYTYRLVAAESPEEKLHETAFQKEIIPKMWFEWQEYCNNEEFELQKIDIEDCDDVFLESPNVQEDIKALYRR